MSDYIGTPYVVLSRSLSAVELYVDSGEVSNEVYVISTGGESLLSFVTELKFSDSKGGGGTDGVITTLSLVDIDNKFEELFLRDALRVAGLSFETIYFTYGMNSVFGPIQLGSLKDIKQTGYSNGSRVIRLVMYSGISKGINKDKELIEGITNNLNATTSSNTYNVPIIYEELELENAFINVSPFPGKPIYKLKPEYVELGGTIFEKPNIPEYFETGYKEYFSEKGSALKVSYDWVPATKPRTAAVNNNFRYEALDFNDVFANAINSVFNRMYLGKYVLLLPNMDKKIADTYSEIGLTTSWFADTNNKKFELLTKLGFDVRENLDTSTIDVRIEIVDDFTTTMRNFFDNLNKILNDLDINLLWESDTELLRILSESVPPLVEYESLTLTDPNFDINLDFEGTDKNIVPTLIIGDTNIINEFLYGTYSDGVLSALYRKDEIISLETPLSQNKYLFKLPHESGKLMINVLLEYKHKSTKKLDGIFSNLFIAEDFIQIYTTSLIDKLFTYNEDLLKNIQEEFILFKYNVPNSNVLSINIDYQSFDFATLAQYFKSFSNIDEILYNIMETLLEEDKHSINKIDKAVELRNNTEDIDIQREVIGALNRAAFTMQISTLPLFTLSTQATMVRMVGMNMSLFEGSYGDNKDNVLNRIFNGLWMIVGYKHTISKTKVQSEFTLKRNNLLSMPNGN